ncbi:MAG: polysaccharide biosynthesis tyrosine autokinase [Thermodesulfovibrionales bacterium]|nr:polysaccharide biosynthesis tyrosine autokinase [Thermodesulfovibrionales bacterium]
MEYEEHNIDIKEYLWIFYKHRWSILTFFVVVVTLTFIFNIIAQPEYRASTKILIEKENPNIVDFKEIYAIDATSQEFYQTQYSILESRFIAREVIEKLGLWKHPELAGKRSGTVPDDLSQEELMRLELDGHERVIDSFLNRLVVQPVRKTQLVTVSYVSTSPEISANVANEVVQAYVEYTLSTKIKANVGASGVLRRQISEERRQLEESEQLLQEYKEKYNIISLEEEEQITIQKLSAHSTDLVGAENERIEAQAKYQIAIAMLEDPDHAGSIPEVMDNAFITKLKTDEAVFLERLSEISRKYGSKHPEVMALNDKIGTVREKIHDEILRVVDSMKSEYDFTLRKERALKEELVRLKEESQHLGKHAVSYNVLARDVQTNKQVYEVLLKRLKETSISGGIQTTNVRVLDSAVPPSAPFRPRRTLNLIMALVFGLFMGPVIAVFFEYLDSSIKSQEDLERYLKVPFLGPVPDFNDLEDMDPGSKSWMLVTSLDTKSVAAEAYRSIRTSIIFSSPDDRSTLLVTSSNPSEGKSVTSSNLAVTMAQNGARTLLLDMDFRRPVIHKIFDIPQEKGLSNVLVGDAELEDVIVHTRVPNLDVISSGHIPPNPAELLSSEGLVNYMNIFKDRYDRIIIDSPPILSATDPVVISTYVDEVLLVIKMGETSRELIRAAIGKLTHVKANLLGTVLNSIAVGQGNYYSSQYPYYGEKKPEIDEGILVWLKTVKKSVLKI